MKFISVSDPKNPEAHASFVATRDEITRHADLFDGLDRQSLGYGSVYDIGVAMAEAYKTSATNRGVSFSVGGNIDSAFSIVARGIEHCADAYSSHNSDNKSVDTLFTAIVDKRTIAFFLELANLHNWENAEYECWLGLRQRSQSSPAMIYADSHFEPDVSRFPSAIDLARRKADLWVAACDGDAPERLPNQAYGVCPGARYIPMVWVAMAKTALESDVLSLYVD